MTGASVLVVDDDAPIRRMLERTLAAEGYGVVGAGGRRRRARGGRAVGARPASCSTWRMPGLDGLAVCRRLRAKGLALPILLLTARDAVADRVAGLDAGADDYLVKPFATEELLARVRALLRRGAAAGEVLAFGDLVLDVETRAARAGRPRARAERRARRTCSSSSCATRGGCVSRAQALERVWGGAAAASLNVVDRYVLVPAAQARRAAADRDRSRRRLRARPMSPRSLGARSILAAGARDPARARRGRRRRRRPRRPPPAPLARPRRCATRAVEVAQLSASAPALLTAPGALDAPLGGQQVERRGASTGAAGSSRARSRSAAGCSRRAARCAR